MKPVLKQEESTYYISESDIIRFISENAPMDWNKCCRFVRDKHITSGDGDKIYWTKQQLSKSKSLNEEQIKWISAFFEAHPWIERMMIVFDD